jgi:hypothetical protein
MKPLYIESVSLLLQEVSESSISLKKELEETSGKKFRRVNHFVLLALASVFRLPNVKTIDPECSLYVGTSNGCSRDTLAMLEQMYRDSLLPMPFTFMGLSTNMASFHIAQNLGLSGTNLTLSNITEPFGAALSLACMDIEMGKTTSALVGCVDEGAFPLNEFNKVIGQQEGAVLLEGGCWMKLASRCDNPIAVIYACESFKTLDDIEEYLKQENLLESHIVRRDDNSSYIGATEGIDFIQAIQEARSKVIVLISRLGISSFSLTLTRILA